MKHGVRIRIGNLAGHVQSDYPKLIAEIAKFPRGRAYLEYIDGYAISRYRTQAGADIGQQLDAAFTLLDNPAMPAKPLYIDEFGDLAGGDGAEPFQAASGLEGARFIAGALERVYSRQDGSPRVPRSVAFWRDQIEPRARNLYSQPEAYLKTPASHITGMFASMNGYARLPVQGPQRQGIAGMRNGQIKTILLPSVHLAGKAKPQQTRSLVISGLRAGAEYAVTSEVVSREQGNPISTFMDGSANYLEDRKGQFKVTEGKWGLASPYWESCYYDENVACAWRKKARKIEAPLMRKSKIRSDANGVLRTSIVIDEEGILMVDVAPVQ
jgi:hypothetical protein